MANAKKKSKKVQCAVKQLKKARSRMKVFKIDNLPNSFVHSKVCICCKGVRCPPIFSLSNLINVGWLVRKCVDIYIHPLIAGTNRKAYLLHASFALKDSHCP